MCKHCIKITEKKGQSCNPIHMWLTLEKIKNTEPNKLEDREFTGTDQDTLVVEMGEHSKNQNVKKML